jgi:hypothetical protein
MPSPFRYNKKERRRLRKSARKSAAVQHFIEAKGPSAQRWAETIAPSTKMMVELNLRQAKARRRKKPKA